MDWELKRELKEQLQEEQGYYVYPVGTRTRFALVYPNSYFVGMSNLGFHIIYDLLNKRDVYKRQEQERGLRAGTENTAGIVGLGESAAIAAAELAEESARLQGLRDHLFEKLLEIPGVQGNGPREGRLPGNLNPVSYTHLDVYKRQAAGQSI